ncbi:hypothetical protein ERO13_D08G096400v2 [Gossypium hirsutum]|uniref:Pentatricopeptide repeat-containing protein n=2 Tax=Gossypium TaxID=3633 RepID=A0A5D2TTU4_GOSMU|nr:hypothetical protein ERO13_D08G096400v2 [Gossypium hirsutum]TYH57696.1 hypothetical protein ES332_D08G107800v1 [Gossypium tomentosum]TYI68672.1 hypothetical protein E1A91_D08G105600v1 [Gossypium mustelinum]KAG4133442.1 hypothetical protein ERO13_D08G096400v2 [Gossypium hirsutum]KAG4133443.1 hypothetical protein ERO13_D08G096400v2 [Gossypium hirsutum]
MCSPILLSLFFGIASDAPDAVTYNAFMNGICKEGRADDAFRLCDNMNSEGLALDDITYTTLIHVSLKAGCKFWHGKFIVDHGTAMILLFLKYCTGC